MVIIYRHKLYVEILKYKQTHTSGHHVNMSMSLRSPGLEPHFDIVKLGFTGVCIIFLIYAVNIDSGNSLEAPR